MIGVPVGFVSAAESKEAVLELQDMLMQRQGRACDRRWAKKALAEVDFVDRGDVEVVAHIPASNGRMISRIYEEAEILNRVDENMTVSITARVSPAFLGRLKGCPDICLE